MPKVAKGATIGLLQSVSRLSRTALAERLLEHGLYAGQDKVMLALAMEGGRTPSQLAHLLGVRPPTITKTINRLATQGFVVKKLSKEDGRRAFIHLTENGRQTIEVIEKSLRKTEKQVLKGLDKKEQKALLRLLEKIEVNMGAGGVVDADDQEELSSGNGS